MRRLVSVFLMALAIVLAAMPGAGRHASAAGAGRDVYVPSYGGIERVAGACLELAPYSNVGCDIDGDGYVRFAAMPLGTYTVIYHSVPAGYALPAPGVLTVPPGGTVAYYHPGFQLRSTTGTVDLSVVVYDDATAEPIVGACVSLRGYSNVGCDVNADGQVEFADIPYGTYLIDVERFPAGTRLAYPDYQDSVVLSAYSGQHWNGYVALAYR